MARLERYLSYTQVSSGAAIDAAREDYKNVSRGRQMLSTLPEAWSKLVAEEDELLLELLADKVESLCGFKPDVDTVARFLRENVGLSSPFQKFAHVFFRRPASAAGSEPSDHACGRSRR